MLYFVCFMFFGGEGEKGINSVGFISYLPILHLCIFFPIDLVLLPVPAQYGCLLTLQSDRRAFGGQVSQASPGNQACHSYNLAVSLFASDWGNWKLGLCEGDWLIIVTPLLVHHAAALLLHLGIEQRSVPPPPGFANIHHKIDYFRIFPK